MELEALEDRIVPSTDFDGVYRASFTGSIMYDDGVVVPVSEFGTTTVISTVQHGTIVFESGNAGNGTFNNSGNVDGFVIISAELHGVPVVVTFSGTATLQPMGISANGTWTTTFSYESGDKIHFGFGDGTWTANRVGAPTSTTLKQSPSGPWVYGSPVSFTATVSADNAPTPTGSVQFTIDGQNFGSPVTLEAGLATSQATTPTEMTVGSHTIAAFYASDSASFFDSNSSAKVEDCPDTAPFIIERAAGQEFTRETVKGEIICKGTGTIFIGRTDGIRQMLHVEGSVEFDKNRVKVNGKVFSLIGAGDVRHVPLFTGQFEVPFTTGTSSSFSETPAEGEYQLGGMDVDFSSISINQNSVSLGAKFQLLEELGTPDFLFSGSDGLIITQNNVDFGSSIKFSAPNFKNFKLFGVMPIEEFSDFSIEYIAAQDTVKIQGKLVVDLTSKPRTGEVTVNLAGDNFIQISGGKVDLMGELTVQTDLKFPPKGWGLRELKLFIDTIKRDVTGGAKLTLPFGQTINVDSKIGFKLPIPPLELNKLSLSVGDRLNLPIPSYPLVFFQRFQGAVENFAESDPDPIEFSGGVSATLGPKFLGISAIELNVNGKLNSEQLVGTGGVTVINDELFKGFVSATLNWDKKYFEATGSFYFLAGLIQASGSFKPTSKFDITMSGSGLLGTPKSLPLFGGAGIVSGKYLLEFSNDGNLSNDYAAGWSVIDLKKIGFDLTFPIGFKGYFDGRIERIGTKDIPKVSSWDIKPGLEWAILGADWEIDTAGDVPVRVEKPDGTFIEEADFAANNIAIVDELTNSNTKVVILFSPEPGIWDLEVVDPTGLGNISYSAAEDAIAPSITVTAPSTDVPSGTVNIAYTATDPDSAAEVRLFYDTDNTGFDGIEIARGLSEADGPGGFVWNTQGIGARSYYVYAMVLDGDNPPAYSYSPGAITQTPVVIVTGGTFAYDGQIHPATGSVVGVNNEDLGTPTFTYTNVNNVTISDPPVNAGTYTVTASFAGNDDYVPASNTATIIISPIAPTVTVSGGLFPYDGQPHPATGSVVGGNGEDLGTPNFTYTDVNSVTISTPPVNAGTYTVTASFAGNDDYNPATATATIVIQRQFVAPHSQGSWKNHTSHWPLTTLTLGGYSYTKRELLALLGTSSTSDARLILARQLIAAKLNLANGSDPALIQATVAHADSLLNGRGKITLGKVGLEKTSSALGKLMVADARLLDAYNIELFVAPHSQGFWKNYPDHWRVSSLTLGGYSYTKRELLALLGSSSTSDPRLILARQLIAAKLNLAIGFDPAPIQATVAHADSLLKGQGKITLGKVGRVKASSPLGKLMVADALLLDAYNNGQLD